MSLRLLKTKYSAGAGPQWFDAGDQNGDAKPNLAALDLNGGTRALLLGTTLDEAHVQNVRATLDQAIQFKHDALVFGASSSGSESLALTAASTEFGAEGAIPAVLVPNPSGAILESW